MGFLKFLGKFFGSFLIILALTMIFTGLSVQYGLENLDVISKSAQENFPKILQENKELLLNAIVKDGKVNKAVMKDTCVNDPNVLPKDFCNRLRMMTEEDALKEFTDITVLKLQDEYKTEFSEDFKKDIESRLGEALLLNYLKYTIPLGLLVFLLGSLLIFLAEKFKFTASLSCISWKTGILSGLAAVMNFLMKNITHEKVENFIKALPMMQGEQGGILAVKLASAALTDWIRIISIKMFCVSFIITAVAFLTVITLFILKRKLGKKEKKLKEEKVVEKEKVSKTKRQEKVLSKRKK